MTVALQNNDLAGVREISERRDGDGSDARDRRPRCRRVRAAGKTAARPRDARSRPTGASTNSTLTFDKGIVHETIRFDPDNKVVGFKYDVAVRAVTVSAFAATFDDVVRAAERLRGVAHRTPAITSATLDERTGARVFLKAENLQRMGAFKFRGAYNRLAQLDAAARAARRRRVLERQPRAGRCAGGETARRAGGDRDAHRCAGQRSSPRRAATAPKSSSTTGCTMNRAEIAARARAPSAARPLVPPYDDPAIIAGAGHGRARADRRRRPARRAAGVSRRRRVAVGLRAGRDGACAGHRGLRRRAGDGRRLGAIARAQRARDDSGAGHDRRRDANAIARAS